MVNEPSKSVFSSNESYLIEQPVDSLNINKLEQYADVDMSSFLSAVDLEAFLTSSGDSTKPLLYKLIYILKGTSETKQTLLTVGFQLMNALFLLLNAPDAEIQTCAYFILQLLADQLDHDGLVENMMDQLICISWEYNDDEDQCYHIAKLSSEYVELFGRGLEKMTKARDWMLFIPFLANYLVKIVDVIEYILIEKSIYFSSTAQKKTNPTNWERTIALLTNNCLDFIEFIHTKTVAQEPAEFPFNTNDIGLENGDTKRRYLGYYLLNLIYEKVILNFDMQLSKTYFEKFHAMYNIKRPSQQNDKGNFDNPDYKPMFDIVYCCSKLALFSGFTFDRMYKLQDSLNQKDQEDISLEDRLSDNDRQMINSRMYPLSYNGIATLASLSLYDKILYPLIFSAPSVGIFPSNVEPFPFAKKYIGIVLNLLTRTSDMICHADKGILVLLYLSDEIKTTVTIDDMEKYIQGPCGNELVFPAARIIEVISSVASTCPDASIRFLSYKLIEKFLNFGNDETRVFFLLELLDRCPFPSMKTAAIGLLKDQIDRSFKELNDKKTFSIFTSPSIVIKFFPLVFKFKATSWKESSGSFWDEYSHVMQALNIYFYLLLKDEKDNLTTVWSTENVNSMKKDYLNPLTNLIQNLEPNKEIHFQEMQVDIMRDVIDKILTKVQK